MSDHAPFLERAFALDLSEQHYTIDTIEGELPPFIQGTYYVNGPARFTTPSGWQYRHWLDGDGMVCALRFASGQVQFINRFVRSTKFVEEEAAGHPLFRTFGTTFGGDRLKRGIALESPVNVSVYSHAGKLLAFGEQGLPWELDPLTLETRGVHTFGGRLNEVSPFSAHPKIDPVTGDMLNFGIAFSATNPQLHVYCIDTHGELRYRKRHHIDYPCSMHDCGLSPSYLVCYLSPYLLDMAAMAQEGQTLMDALRWEPERGSQLLLVSRDTGDAVASLPIGQRYCLHLINCFETEDHLVVDVVEYKEPIYDQYQTIPALFTDVREAQPVRFVIDRQQHTAIERQILPSRLAPDFPTVAPVNAMRPYQDFWMLSMGAPGEWGRKFFNQLVHANWQVGTACDVYQAPPNCYLGGEPVFVGSPQQADVGVIVCQVFDAERTVSAFALFDAFQVARGPVALLHLRDPIPPLFHASFQPEQTQA